MSEFSNDFADSESMDGRKYRESPLGDPGQTVRVPCVSFPFLHPLPLHFNVAPASPPPPISMLNPPCVSVCLGPGEWEIHFLVSVVNIEMVQGGGLVR